MCITTAARWASASRTLPRTGELRAELDVPETLFARKNFGMDEMPHDGRHAWLRLTPEKIVSWDFRKLARLS